MHDFIEMIWYLPEIHQTTFTYAVLGKSKAIELEIPLNIKIYQRNQVIP